VKIAHKLAEEGRVGVRNVRHGALDAIKKAKLSQDETKRLEKDLQTATDKAIADINAHLAAKEKELLTV
jgi:ribosome recycling factor